MIEGDGKICEYMGELSVNIEGNEIDDFSYEIYNSNEKKTYSPSQNNCVYQIDLGTKLLRNNNLRAKLLQK